MGKSRSSNLVNIMVGGMTYVPGARKILHQDMDQVRDKCNNDLRCPYIPYVLGTKTLALVAR